MGHSQIKMHSLYKNIWEDGENLIIDSNQNSVIQKTINNLVTNSSQFLWYLSQIKKEVIPPPFQLKHI